MKARNQNLLKTGIPGYQKLKQALEKVLAKNTQPKKTYKNLQKIENYISENRHEYRSKYLNQTGRIF